MKITAKLCKEFRRIPRPTSDKEIYPNSEGIRRILEYVKETLRYEHEGYFLINRGSYPMSTVVSVLKKRGFDILLTSEHIVAIYDITILNEYLKENHKYSKYVEYKGVYCNYQNEMERYSFGYSCLPEKDIENIKILSEK